MSENETSIRIFGRSEYPTVFEYGGELFATRGVEYTWSPTFERTGIISGAVATFLASILGDLVTRRTEPMIAAPNGSYVAVSAVTPRLPMALAEIPAGIACSRTHTRKDLVRRAASETYLQYVRESAWQEIFRTAAMHGIPNVNKNIVAVCEKAQTRTLTEEDVATIRHSSSQLRAITSAYRVLSPGWTPDRTQRTNQQIHKQLRRQEAVQRQALAERKIEIKLQPCNDQLIMSNDDIDAMLFNVISNIAKYSRPGTDARISFAPSDGFFEIIVDVTSCNIYPEEVQRIVRLGYRGRRAVEYTSNGQGFGLTMIDRVATGYGGALRVVAGAPDNSTAGFSTNQFRIRFPLSMVVLVGPSGA